MLLVLSACLPLSGVRKSAPPAQVDNPAMQLFVAGIDHFDSSHRSDAFLRLEQQFPNSAWNRRAKILASLAGSLRLLEKQIKRQQALIEGQKNDHLDLIELKQENELLRDQVKVLKSLIVDLELRQP